MWLALRLLEHWTPWLFRLSPLDLIPAVRLKRAGCVSYPSRTYEFTPMREPNPGPGGYGAVLLYPRKRAEVSGGFRKTSNNRMEIFAATARNRRQAVGSEPPPWVWKRNLGPTEF